MTTNPPAKHSFKPVPTVTGSGVTWHHVNATKSEDVDFISNLFPANRFDLADCISQRGLPTVVNRPSYLFAILHFPRFIEEKKTVVPRQLSIFVSNKVVVTVHQSSIKAIDELFSDCAGNPDTSKELLDKEPADLLYRILDVSVDDLFPMLSKTLEALDGIEDEIFDERQSMAKEVNILRRDVADQRRILFPMSKLISEIQSKAKQYSRNDLDLHYEDLHDKVVKAWHTLDSAWERVEIFKDTDFVLSSEKTNKILALLTIIFTMSIPATAIGTIYGMNINLPGGIEAGAWSFWGKYTTLWVIVTISIIPAIVMAFYFRKWHWL